MTARLFLALALVLLAAFNISAADETWKAGVAKASITPDQFMWMAGYANRDKPATGKATDLWAKALAIEDPAGKHLNFRDPDNIALELYAAAG